MTSQIKRFGDYVIRDDLAATLLDEMLRWESSVKGDDRLADQLIKDGETIEQLSLVGK